MMSVKLAPSASRTSTRTAVVRPSVARSMICPNEDRRHGPRRGRVQRFPVDGDGDSAVPVHVEHDEREVHRDEFGIEFPHGSKVSQAGTRVELRAYDSRLGCSAPFTRPEPSASRPQKHRNVRLEGD